MKRPSLSVLRKNWYLVSVVLALLAMVLFMWDAPRRKQTREQEHLRREQSLDTLIHAAEKLSRGDNRDKERAVEKYVEAIRLHKEKAAHLHLEVAKLQAARGLYDRAREHLHHYLQDAPGLLGEDRAFAYELLGDYLVRKDWEKALAAYRTIETTYPGYRAIDEVYYKIGAVFLQRDRYEDAKKALESVAKSARIGTRVRKRVLLAVIALQGGSKPDWKTVIEYTDKVIEGDARMEPAVYYTALILGARASHARNEKNDYFKALKKYKIAAKNLPDRTHATEEWFAFVRLKGPKGMAGLPETDAFRSHFERARDLAKSLSKMDKFKEAISLYKALGDLVLKPSARYAEIGKAYEGWAATTADNVKKNKRWLAAADTFLKAYEADPLAGNSSQHLLDAANAYEKAKRLGNMVQALGKHVEKSNDVKKRGESLKRMAGAYRRLGLFEKALKKYEELVGDDYKANEDFYYHGLVGKGNVLAALGRLEEAVAVFEIFFAKENPVSPATNGRIAATLALAKLYFRMAMRKKEGRSENLTKSVAKAEEFVARYPGRDGNKDALQRLYRATFVLARGRFEQALVAFKIQDYNKARTQFQRAEMNFKKVSRWRKGKIKENPDVRRQSDLFSAHALLQQALCSAQPDKPLLRQALEEFRAVSGSHLRTREALQAMKLAAVCLQLLDRPLEADRMLDKARRAMATFQKTNGKGVGGYLEELLAESVAP